MRLIIRGLLGGTCLWLLGCTAPAPAPTLEAEFARLERSEADAARDVTAQPLAVLDFFGIGPGMQVADLFAGGGYYSELLALAVGDTGRVTAYNNPAYDSFGGAQKEARFADDRLPNVTYLVAEAAALELPPDLDAAMMVMSFHDLYWVDEAQGWPAIDARAFMTRVLNSLRPGGTLAIIDHHAVAGSGTEAIASLHRIDRSFVIAELEAVGFELEAESALLSNPADDRSKLVFDPEIRRKTDRFMLRFRKPRA